MIVNELRKRLASLDGTHEVIVRCEWPSEEPDGVVFDLRDVTSGIDCDTGEPYIALECSQFDEEE